MGKIHKSEAESITNVGIGSSLLVKAKLVGDEFVFFHYFANEDEIHGWIIGMHDLADNLGYAIEYITVNDEIREGVKK